MSAEAREGSVASLQTEWLRFGGMNIKGTPRMSVPRVSSDLRWLAETYDSAVVCEFKWDYYWGRAKYILGMDREWEANPSYNRGKAAPVVSGQANFWKNDVFNKKRAKRALCHLGHAGISELRFIRGTLLDHIDTGLKHWEVVAHFVVGGDADGDSPTRKKILRNNIRRFVRFLRKLKKGGHAILGQLDANIHRGTWAFDLFMTEMRKIGADFIGELGVEYLFKIDGERVKVQTGKPVSLLPKHRGGVLETDHESRGMQYRLVEMAA